jgi:DNA processing protein
MTQATRLARIALGLLVEPGHRDLGELVGQVGATVALDRLRTGTVAPGLLAAVRPRWGPADPLDIAGRALERAERLGVRIVTPEDDEWPPQLQDLVRISQPVSDPIRRNTYPPHCIWVRGPWPLAETCERSVAVVGARASTAYGEHVAGDLGYGLAERGWTVVSGGAFGIDAAAHRGAMAAGGRTVAVLACGIERPYPVSHAALFERIAETGLVLSEWPPGADPHRHRFLIRNRVIAAATRGTVMVEANLRSGARFTLHRARALNRMVMVVPGPVTSAMSVGSHEELRVENTVLVTGVAHVIDAVGSIGDDLAPVLRAPEGRRDQLTPLQRQVLDGVRPRKLLTAEEIAAAVGVSARDARRALPALEQARFVTVLESRYRLFRKSDADPGRRATRTGRRPRGA